MQLFMDQVGRDNIQQFTSEMIELFPTDQRQDLIFSLCITGKISLESDDTSNEGVLIMQELATAVSNLAVAVKELLVRAQQGAPNVKPIVEEVEAVTKQINDFLNPPAPVPPVGTETVAAPEATSAQDRIAAEVA